VNDCYDHWLGVPGSQDHAGGFCTDDPTIEAAILGQLGFLGNHGEEFNVPILPSTLTKFWKSFLSPESFGI
jgi:hypothetical protein